MGYPHFRFYKRQDILSITRLRRFETKLGECLQTANSTALQESLLQSKAAFVLIGIPEDIGVLANCGTGGADTAWLPFLKAFCNIQSTDVFTGEEAIALGHFDFSDIKSMIVSNAKNEEELVDACRHAVANIIDTEVEALMKLVTVAGKTPVVIGGGHNNAYPLIKGTAKGLHKAGKIATARLNVINADAHADYRVMEGRHSGNGFRYAKQEGFLNRYAVIGLHENYNNQGMLEELYNDVTIQYSTIENIYIREKLNFRQAVVQAISFTEDHYTGIELDMDSIAEMLSSGAGPSGFTSLHARQYISLTGSYTKVAYLHICEGAEQLANGQANPLAGKFISELVSDFIKTAQLVRN